MDGVYLQQALSGAILPLPQACIYLYAKCNLELTCSMVQGDAER